MILSWKHLSSDLLWINNFAWNFFFVWSCIPLLRCLCWFLRVIGTKSSEVAVIKVPLKLDEGRPLNSKEVLVLISMFCCPLLCWTIFPPKGCNPLSDSLTGCETRVQSVWQLFANKWSVGYQELNIRSTCAILKHCWLKKIGKHTQQILTAKKLRNSLPSTSHFLARICDSIF